MIAHWAEAQCHPVFIPPATQFRDIALIHNPDARRDSLDSNHGRDVKRWTEALVDQDSHVPHFVGPRRGQRLEFLGYWPPVAYDDDPQRAFVKERDRICRALIPDREILRGVTMEQVAG